MKKLIKKLLSMISITVIVSSGFAQADFGIELISSPLHAWDDVKGVVLQGNYAYVAASWAGLQIVEVSDPTNPTVVGRWLNSQGDITTVAVAGRYAYLFDRFGFVYAIDVADPSHPREIGCLEYEQGEDVKLTVDGDYLYLNSRQGLDAVDISQPRAMRLVSSYSNGVEDGTIAISGNRIFLAFGSRSIQVLDISNPLRIERIGLFQTEERNGLEAFAVDGNRLYAVGRRIWIVDVSNIDSMFVLGSLDNPRGEGEVAICNGYFLLSIGDFKVIDFSDPANPVTRSQIDGGGYISVDGDLCVIAGKQALRFGTEYFLNTITLNEEGQSEQVGAFTTREEWNYSVVEDGFAYLTDVYDLSIYNVQDPDNVVLVSQMEDGGLMWPLVLEGDLLIANDMDGFIRFINIGDRANPRRISTWNANQDQIADFEISEEIVYVLTYVGGLYIVDVTSPQNPRLLSSTSRGLYSAELSLDFPYVYIATESGVRIVDVTDPERPEEVRFIQGFEVQTVAASGGLVAYSDVFVHIADVSNPAQPRPLTTLEIQGHDLKIVDGFLYSTGSMGRKLLIHNMNNPESILLAGSCTVPGRAGQIDVEGDLAYISAGSSYSIFDCSEALHGNPPPIDTTGGNYGLTRLSSTFNAWNFPTDCVVDENFLFVVTDPAGLQILDVSTPERPEMVSFTRTYQRPTRIDVENDIAFVGEAQAMEIFEVSDPANPMRLARFRLFDVNAVAVDGNRMIISEGVLSFWDVSDPTHPLRQASILNDMHNDVEIVGNTAYAASIRQFIEIYNIEDISNPRLISQTEEAEQMGEPLFIAVRDGILYGGYQSGVVTYDVSSPDDPMLLGSVEFGPSFSGISLQGDYLYCSDYGWDGSDTMGFRVVNITDPANPWLEWSDEPFGTAIDTQNDKAYFIRRNGLTTFDLSDPGVPSNVGGFAGPTELRNIHIEGNKAFIAMSDSGAGILDITEPENPIRLGIMEVGDGGWGWDVDAEGDLACIGSYSTGTWIYNIANPESPELLAHIEMGAPARGICLEDTLLLIAADFAGLLVFDISVPAEPEFVFQYRSDRADGYCVEVRDRIVYLVDGNRFTTIDIHDLNAPFVMNTYSGLANCDNFALDGNFAYCTDFREGVVVLDVTDPARIQQTLLVRATYPTLGVGVENGVMAVACGDSGIYMFDVSNLEHGVTRIGRYDTPGESMDIAIIDSTIYLSDKSSFDTYRFTKPNEISRKEYLPVSIGFEVFPNPGNGYFTLKFDLSKPDVIRMAIFDIAGRQIAKTFDARMMAGEHQIGWNATNLTTGVYFIRFEYGGKSLVQKILLLR